MLSAFHVQIKPRRSSVDQSSGPTDKTEKTTRCLGPSEVAHHHSCASIHQMRCSLGQCIKYAYQSKWKNKPEDSSWTHLHAENVPPLPLLRECLCFTFLCMWLGWEGGAMLQSLQSTRGFPVHEEAWTWIQSTHLCCKSPRNGKKVFS